MPETSSTCARPCHDAGVVISRRLLNDDENVVVSTRTHVKALLLPAVVLIVVAAAAGYLAGLPTGGAKKPLVALILVSFAESSILVEFGWLVFVICSVKASQELSWRKALSRVSA